MAQCIHNLSMQFNSTRTLPPIFSFRPDVAMFVQKVEQEKVAKERGETKDNRSFIAKYVS